MPFVVDGGIYCLAAEATSARAPPWGQIFVVCSSLSHVQLLLPILWRKTSAVSGHFKLGVRYSQNTAVVGTQARILAQGF